MQRLHNQPHTIEIAQAHISYTQKVVEAVQTILIFSEPPPEKARPMSPVKAITNLLGSYMSQYSSPIKQNMERMPINLDPFVAPHNYPTAGHKKSYSESNIGSGSIGKKQAQARESIFQLEDTLNTYLVAIQTRRGNLVGRSLRGRSTASELSVNELYNSLIEDPSRHQAAAEVPVDVLFVAFEKFLQRAWSERMGPVLTRPLLQEMHSILGSTSEHSTREFQSLLERMTTQNRTALSTIVSLLSDLLAAAGNDSDRGALVVTFAEILAGMNAANDFLPLLDRLVEQSGVLFPYDQLQRKLDTINEGYNVETNTTKHGSVSRTRSTTTDSVSSTTSSIKRKFGLGTLTRENSKLDTESKLGQVWRTLSKNRPTETLSQTPSLPRSFLARARSTDVDPLRPALARPDLPSRPISSSSRDDDSRSRPGSAHNAFSGLATIGEAPPDPKATLKKKRRSSLSDLKELKLNGVSSFGVPSAILRVDQPDPFVQPPRALNSIPKPVARLQKSPPPEVTRPSAMTVPVKENVPIKPSRLPTPDRFDDPNSALGPRKRDYVRKGVPNFRQGLAERANSNENGINVPAPARKLKMQSPQKLRERLDKEKKAMQEANPGLQADLAKIGAELSALNLSHQASQPSSDTLSAKLEALERRVSQFMTDSSEQLSSIKADVESSIVVIEKKAKGLDELYREANAENELLYERFNTELSKVLKAVKGGQGVEELRTKLKEAQDDAQRLRNENQRLKRENVGLRSQLRDG